MNPHRPPSPSTRSTSPTLGCTTRCAAQAPLVVLVGAPMDATSLRPAGRPARRRPHRAHHRPARHQPQPGRRPDQDSTPQMRADDLARLLAHLDAGPAVVLGSSGGAVSVLALVQAHPELVHTVIAHEPPLDDLLDDRDQLHAADRGHDRHLPVRRRGRVPGRKFLAIANIQLPERRVRGDVRRRRETRRRPPTSTSSSRTCSARPSGWQPDIARAARRPTRIVVGIGEESTGQLCDRTSRRWRRCSASSRPCSPATTSASPRTRRRSPSGSVRSDGEALQAGYEVGHPHAWGCPNPKPNVTHCSFRVISWVVQALTPINSPLAKSSL